jgi:hypothetical protein
MPAERPKASNASNKTAHAPIDVGNAEDSVRVDISPIVTDKLIAHLGAVNWKERKAAVDDIEQILSDTGTRVLTLLDAYCFSA